MKLPDSPEILQPKLVDALQRQGVEVEALHLIGLLDHSARSSVFSALINHEYYVIKLYHIHANFVRDMRNYRRLTWPPPIFLSSKRSENALGRDLVITRVPAGSSFTSANLLDWVRDRLGAHLVELHRSQRARRVSVAGLHRSVNDTEAGALAAAEQHGGPTARQATSAVIEQMHQFLNHRAPIMRVKPSLLHNDPWWDNIIVAKDDVYLIDWEWMSVGDYALDIAYARIMLFFRPVHDHSRGFWVTPRDEDAADRFFAGIAEAHCQEFNDHTLFERLKFYLALQTLRRLSDYAAGTFEDYPELLAYWVEQLPRFWHHGLGEAAASTTSWESATARPDAP
ncbi:MAG TPA: phosphotransferase [Candidatus Saccharimonadia bacterium]|nr:phosphotransferase [Candidatus Saccharimonadia bacterium]